MFSPEGFGRPKALTLPMESVNVPDLKNVRYCYSCISPHAIFQSRRQPLCTRSGERGTVPVSTPFVTSPC